MRSLFCWLGLGLGDALNALSCLLQSAIIEP